MTVPAYTGPNTSVANGVTTVFPYDFKILAASDLLVTVDGLPRQLGTHYTVDGVGDMDGGNVTFLVAPAANAVVNRQRAMPFTRLTDYQNLGDLLSSTLNDDQDAPILMIQQLAAAAMLQILDPDGSGAFIWDAKGMRIVRVGDAVADTDALNYRSALTLVEQIQAGGGSVGITPKGWTWEGDGDSTDFELPGADVFDVLFYDTYMEGTAGAGDYRVVPPADYTILPGVDGGNPVIRFAVAPADGVRGGTVLRGYARPWIGQTPIYTVAPEVITTITGDATLDASRHNTLILINSATPVTLTIRANTGSTTADWTAGQYFSVVQLGTGAVTLAIEGGAGTLTVPTDFAATTRGQGCVITGTCYAPDADGWLAAGDLLRTTVNPDKVVIELMDRSVLIGTNIATGTGKDSYVLPFGIILDSIAAGGCYASLAVAQTAGVLVTVDVNRNGTSIIDTKLTFDNAEKTTATAATPAVFAAGGQTLYKGDEITIDVDQIGTALAKGLRVYLVGQRAS